MEPPYKLDFGSNEYVCGICGRRFPVAYRYKTKTPRTMSQRNGLPGQAAANFNKHLFSCWKKQQKAEQGGRH